MLILKQNIETMMNTQGTVEFCLKWLSPQEAGQWILLSNVIQYSLLSRGSFMKKCVKSRKWEEIDYGEKSGTKDDGFFTLSSYLFVSKASAKDRSSIHWEQNNAVLFLNQWAMDKSTTSQDLGT